MKRATVCSVILLLGLSGCQQMGTNRDCRHHCSVTVTSSTQERGNNSPSTLNPPLDVDNSGDISAIPGL